MDRLENGMKRKWMRLITAVVVMLGSDLSAYQVIVNNGVPIDSVSKNDLKNIYLGKKSRWDCDEKIEAVTLSCGDTHSCFLNDIVQKTPAQFGIYWKRVIFTGKGVPFHKVDSEEEMVDYVQSTPGAVGYISDGAPTGSTKKVRVE